MMHSGHERECVEHGGQIAITSNMRKLHSGFIPLRERSRPRRKLGSVSCMHC